VKISSRCEEDFDPKNKQKIGSLDTRIRIRNIIQLIACPSLILIALPF
jgi:hypothetical protein